MDLLKAENLLLSIAKGSTSYVHDLPACSFCDCIIDEDEEHNDDCLMLLAREALGDKWKK